MRKDPTVFVLVLLGFLAGAVLCLYVPSPTPFKAGSQEQKKAENENEKRNDNNNPSLTSPISSADKQSNQQNHEPSSNWWIAGFTGILAVVAILQWIVYRDTLAANKTIERAYVTLSNISTGLRSDVTEQMRVVGGPGNQNETILIRHMSVTLEVKNHGKTPADLLGGIVSLVIEDNPPQSTSPTNFFSYLPPFFLVSGDTKKWRPTFHLPETLYENIQRANPQLWVVGYIDYRDRFGDKHRCNYGRHYIPPTWADNSEGFLQFDVTTASLNNDNPLTAYQEEEREKYKGRPEMIFEQL